MKTWIAAMLAGIFCWGGIDARGDVVSLDNGEVLMGNVTRFENGVFFGYFTGSDRLSFTSGEVKRISFSTGRQGMLTTTSGKTDTFPMASFENGRFVWMESSVETASIQAEQIQRALFSSQETSRSSMAGAVREITLPGGATMRMRWCPAGSFTMGSPVGEPGRINEETQHHVTLTKGFWLAETEVTQAQWRSVMRTNPSKVQWPDNLPVENVSWRDCQEFCRRAGLRLPTEAEWEYACRAGSTGPYGGSGRLDEMGWYVGNSGKRTHPVGQKQANAWGFYDMHGNVWEWCADQYDDYPRGPVRDPRGPASVAESRSIHFESRVLRGGCSWYDSPACRSAYRNGNTPGFKQWNIGFRPAMDRQMTLAF